MEITGSFLPSEIARLVLGYLKLGGFMRSYQTFLQECPHLVEYRTMLRQGYEFPLTVGGTSLTTILQEYGRLKMHDGALEKLTAITEDEWKSFNTVIQQFRSIITNQRIQSDFKTKTTSPSLSRSWSGVRTRGGKTASHRRHSSFQYQDTHSSMDDSDPDTTRELVIASPVKTTTNESVNSPTTTDSGIPLSGSVMSSMESQTGGLTQKLPAIDTSTPICKSTTSPGHQRHMSGTPVTGPVTDQTNPNAQHEVTQDVDMVDRASSPASLSKPVSSPVSGRSKKDTTLPADNEPSSQKTDNTAQQSTDSHSNMRENTSSAERSFTEAMVIALTTGQSDPNTLLSLTSNTGVADQAAAVPSLPTTPVKCRPLKDARSPRRKSSAPKRRSGGVKSGDGDNSNDSKASNESQGRGEVQSVCDGLLKMPVLVEKLAMNINQSMGELTDKTKKPDSHAPESTQSSGLDLEGFLQDDPMTEEAVKHIIETTSNDPDFEALFNLFKTDPSQSQEQPHIVSTSPPTQVPVTSSSPSKETEVGNTSPSPQRTTRSMTLRSSTTSPAKPEPLKIASEDSDGSLTEPEVPKPRRRVAPQRKVKSKAVRNLSGEKPSKGKSPAKNSNSSPMSLKTSQNWTLEKDPKGWNLVDRSLERRRNLGLPSITKLKSSTDAVDSKLSGGGFLKLLDSGIYTIVDSITQPQTTNSDHPVSSAPMDSAANVASPTKTGSEVQTIVLSQNLTSPDKKLPVQDQESSLTLGGTNFNLPTIMVSDSGNTSLSMPADLNALMNPAQSSSSHNVVEKPTAVCTEQEIAATLVSLANEPVVKPDSQEVPSSQLPVHTDCFVTINKDDLADCKQRETSASPKKTKKRSPKTKTSKVVSKKTESRPKGSKTKKDKSASDGVQSRSRKSSSTKKDKKKEDKKTLCHVDEVKPHMVSEVCEETASDTNLESKELSPKKDQIPPEITIIIGGNYGDTPNNSQTATVDKQPEVKTHVEPQSKAKKTKTSKSKSKTKEVEVSSAVKNATDRALSRPSDISVPDSIIVNHAESLVESRVESELEKDHESNLFVAQGTEQVKSAPSQLSDVEQIHNNTNTQQLQPFHDTSTNAGCSIVDGGSVLSKDKATKKNVTWKDHCGTSSDDVCALVEEFSACSSVGSVSSSYTLSPCAITYEQQTVSSAPVQSIETLTQGDMTTSLGFSVEQCEPLTEPLDFTMQSKLDKGQSKATPDLTHEETADDSVIVEPLDYTMERKYTQDESNTFFGSVNKSNKTVEKSAAPCMETQLGKPQTGPTKHMTHVTSDRTMFGYEAGDPLANSVVRNKPIGNNAPCHRSLVETNSVNASSSPVDPSGKSHPDQEKRPQFSPHRSSKLCKLIEGSAASLGRDMPNTHVEQQSPVKSVFLANLMESGLGSGPVPKSILKPTQPVTYTKGRRDRVDKSSESLKRKATDTGHKQSSMKRKKTQSLKMAFADMNVEQFLSKIHPDTDDN